MERAVDHVIHSALTLLSHIPPSLPPSLPPSQVVELHPTGPAAQSTLISVGEHGVCECVCVRARERVCVFVRGVACVCVHAHTHDSIARTIPSRVQSCSVCGLF